MNYSNLPAVTNLGRAENDFLELLITRFQLHRLKRKKGVRLELEFDRETLAITQRLAKDEVQKNIEKFDHKWKAYEAKLDDFLLKGQGDLYHYEDDKFPFRYGSGGTLPILRLGGEEYYCLFYRDVYPVGWNIANGGTDSIYELLLPLETIERELREELIILDLKKEKRYVFESDYGKRLDRPEFAVARRILKERFKKNLDLARFEELAIPLKWFDGPDSLKVTFNNKLDQKGKTVIKRDMASTSGCFLNINAEDYGIEIDRVAKLNVDEDVILCDGEIIQNQLINRPVGLFQVDRMHKMLAEEVVEFIPDRFFYTGRCYCGPHLERVLLEEALPEIEHLRTSEQIKYWHSRKDKKFALCPVTSRILQRYSSIKPRERKLDTSAFEVFISFGHEDEEHAERVFTHLEPHYPGKIFFSKRTLGFSHPWGRALDEALDSAQCLIAVGTDRQHLLRPWPDYEWRSLFMEKQNRRKPEARIIPFISFDPGDLPRPLSISNAITFELADPIPGLNELARCISQPSTTT